MTNTSDDINEIGIPVVTASSKFLHVTSTLLCVLVPTQGAVRSDQYPAGAEQSENDGMAFDEGRSLLGRVYERGWKPSTVCDSQL